jgi:hypothetical protein
MAGDAPQAANEGLAQYIAWVWLAAQFERLYQRSNQCVREYQDILLSLDMKSQLRAKARNLFNAGLALASAASLGIGGLVNQAVLRGTGRLLTNWLTVRLAPGVAARAVAAEATEAAMVAEQVAARQIQYQAAAAAGRMLKPPPWLIKALEVAPQQIWKEKWLRLMMAPFRFLPLAGAHLYINAEMGSTGKPRGSMGTVYHLATSHDTPDQEMRLTLARSESIITTLLAGMPEDKASLLALSDDDLLLLIAHLDAQVSSRLRDDPKLRAEKVDEETWLFLRAQLLMDYWLDVQNWADQQRMTAVQRCGQAAGSIR